MHLQLKSDTGEHSVTTSIRDKKGNTGIEEYWFQNLMKEVSEASYLKGLTQSTAPVEGVEIPCQDCLLRIKLLKSLVPLLTCLLQKTVYV